MRKSFTITPSKGSSNPVVIASDHLIKHVVKVDI